MAPEEPLGSTHRSVRTNDDGQAPPTNRRTFLRAAGASAVGASLSGCFGGLGNQRFEANPVKLKEGDHGYVLEKARSSKVSRQKSIKGQTVKVTLISKLAGYEGKAIGGTSPFTDQASLGLASTPAAELRGVALNPVAEKPLEELLTGDAGAAFRKQVDLGGASWQDGPKEVDSSEGELLGKSAEVKTFAGTTSEDEFVLLNVARVTDGDDAVLVGTSRSKSFARPKETFVGDNGYITAAERDESNELFVAVLPYVVHGKGLEFPSVTATPSGGTGSPTGTTELEPVEINTEEVPQAEEEPADVGPPPEGYPKGEERHEELKEAARKGQMPMPPESEVQPVEEGAGLSAAGADEDAATISVGQEFAAWDDGNLRTAPPDPNIAVGTDTVVVAANLRWGIYDRGSGNRQYQVNLEDWWAPVLPDNDRFVFDPKVLYDHESDRFVLIAVSKPPSDDEGSWVVAVSDDANPFGTWWLTRIPHDDGWVDYPGFGVDRNGIYLTANIFDSADNYQYTRLVSIDKQALYNGNTFTYWWWNGLENPDGSNAFTVQASHGVSTDDSQYLVNSHYGQGSSLTLWEISNPTSSPRLSKQKVGVSSYGMPPNADTPDTSSQIDTSDTRLMNAVYENGSLWTAHAIAYDWGDDDTECIVKWYEIDVNNGSVVQSRGFGSPDEYFCFPTVASDGETSTMIVYNRTGEELAPSIEVGGRTTGHTKNSIEDWARIKTGESGWSGYRWGDYNGIVVDPSVTSYWTYSEYAEDSSTTNEFETWVGEVSF